MGWFRVVQGGLGPARLSHDK